MTTSRFVFNIIYLFAVIIGVISCGKKSTNPGNDSVRRILFDSGNYYHTEIYTINPDGTNLKQLTHTDDDVRNFDATWSPDGSKIVFHRNYWSDSDTMYANDIYIMDADGGNQLKLPGDSKSGYPLFSPDGSRISFWSRREGLLNLFVMNSDGTDQRKLSDDEGEPMRGYSWSPDGSQIVYNTVDRKIITVHSDGTGRQELAEGIEPRWSLDGSLIAFTTPWGSNEIVVMTPDGSDQRQLTDFGIETASWPVWSPDGSMILFLVYDKENTDNSMNNIIPCLFFH